MTTEPIDRLSPNVDLRPLSLGEILDRTAQLYRSNFLLFVGIAVLPRALLLVWQLLQLAITRYLTAHQLPTTAFTISAGLLILLPYFAFVGLGLAAINRAVSAIYLGQTATIAQSYQQVKPHWLRYLLIMFLSTLYAWGPTLVPYVAIFAVIGFNGKKFLAGGAAGGGQIAGIGGGNPFAAVAIFGVAGLVMLVTVPLGIWMTLRYSMAVPASIFENIGARASMKRSVFLTKKGRGRIFVMLLLVGIVFWIIAVAAEMPFMIAVFKAAKNHQQPPVVSLVYSQFVSFFLYSLIGPVYGIAMTLFYYDERIRKEGFDIEWMMERARLTGTGFVPPPPAAEPSYIEEPPFLDPQGPGPG